MTLQACFQTKNNLNLCFIKNTFFFFFLTSRAENIVYYIRVTLSRDLYCKCNHEKSETATGSCCSYDSGLLGSFRNCCDMWAGPQHLIDNLST